MEKNLIRLFCLTVSGMSLKCWAKKQKYGLSVSIYRKKQAQKTERKKSTKKHEQER